MVKFELSKPQSLKKLDLPILVVDQDEYTLDHMRKWAQESPYQLEIATNSFEGLECLDHSEYSLLFCSAEMPGISGLEMLKALRTTPKLKENRNIPAILMVNSESEAEKALTKRMKLLAALYKPFDEYQFQQMIRIYLGL